jgi:ATP adenylyltransferase
VHQQLLHDLYALDRRETTMTDRLWAPWRIGYVARDDKEEGCFLCAAAACDDDRAEMVVRRTPLCFAILNRFPYNNGHVLVAPREHKADLTDLTGDELAEMTGPVAEIETALRATFNPHGFNIGLNIGAAAGAGVPGHIHAHVVPRWTGDTNFISTCADAKVISQSLDAARDALAGFFAGQEDNGE